MSNKVYFVLAVDVEDATISIDDDVYTAKFDKNEGYYNSDIGEWLPDPKQVYYNKALKILNSKTEIESE